MLRTEITGWDITYIILVIIVLMVAYVCYREGEKNGHERGYRLGVKNGYERGYKEGTKNGYKRGCQFAVKSQPRNVSKRDYKNQ